MKKILFLLCTLALLSSCSEKKVVVMSKGPADVNTDNKTIKATDGAGDDMKEFTVSSSKAVFKLSTPAGEATVELLENGLYVINVKNDTIIGSYQKYGAPQKVQSVITQDNLKLQLDSLKLLSEGKNVSDKNKNFFILPNKAARITDNTDAIIVGPYHRMGSVEKINGKDPEVYRFYSIKEVREMIAKLEVLTTPKKI